jgi:hypothetical protein
MILTRYVDVACLFSVELIAAASGALTSRCFLGGLLVYYDISE